MDGRNAIFSHKQPAYAKASLDGVVDRLLKTGSAEQKAAAKDLFSKTLAFGLQAKAANAYFDGLQGGE